MRKRAGVGPTGGAHQPIDLIGRMRPLNEPVFRGSLHVIASRTRVLRHLADALAAAQLVQHPLARGVLVYDPEAAAEHEEGGVGCISLAKEGLTAAERHPLDLGYELLQDLRIETLEQVQ